MKFIYFTLTDKHKSGHAGIYNISLLKIFYYLDIVYFNNFELITDAH